MEFMDGGVDSGKNFDFENLDLRNKSLEESLNLLHAYTIKISGGWGVSKSLHEILKSDLNSSKVISTYTDILLKICALLDEKKVDYKKFWSLVESEQLRDCLNMVVNLENTEDSTILLILLLRYFSTEEYNREKKGAIIYILKYTIEIRNNLWNICKYETYFSPEFISPIVNAFIVYDLDLKFLIKDREPKYLVNILSFINWNEVYFNMVFDISIQNGGTGLIDLISKLKRIEDSEKLQNYLPLFIKNLEKVQNEENKYEILSIILDILYHRTRSINFIEKILSMIEPKIQTLNERFHQYFLTLFCAKIYKISKNSSALLPMIESCYLSIQNISSNFQRSLSYLTIASEFSSVIEPEILERLLTNAVIELETIDNVQNKLLAYVYLSECYLILNMEDKCQEYFLKIKEIIGKRGTKENIKETFKLSNSLLYKFNQLDIIYFLSIELEKKIDWEFDIEYTTIDIIDFLSILQNLTKHEMFNPFLSKCLQELKSRDLTDSKIIEHLKVLVYPSIRDDIFNYIIKNFIKNKILNKDTIINLFMILPYDYSTEKKKIILDRIFLNLKVQHNESKKIQSLYQLLKHEKNSGFRIEILRFTFKTIINIDFIRVRSDFKNDELIKNYYDLIIILQNELHEEELSFFLKRKFFYWNEVFFESNRVDIYNSLIEGFEKRKDIEKAKFYLLKMINIFTKENYLVSEPENLLIISKKIGRLLEKDDSKKIYQLLVQSIQKNSPGYNQLTLKYIILYIINLKDKELILFFLSNLKDIVESLHVFELNILFSFGYLRVGQLEYFNEIWEREIQRSLDRNDFIELESIIIETLTEVSLYNNLDLKIKITEFILDLCEKFKHEMDGSLEKIYPKILKIFSPETNKYYIKKYIPIIYKKSQDFNDLDCIQILITLSFLDSANREDYLRDIDVLLEKFDEISYGYHEILLHLDDWIENTHYREIFNRIENLYFIKFFNRNPNIESTIFFAKGCINSARKERSQIYLNKISQYISLNRNDEYIIFKYLDVLDLYFYDNEEEKYIETLEMFLSEISVKKKFSTGGLLTSLLDLINRYEKYELFSLIENFFLKSPNFLIYHSEFTQFIGNTINAQNFDERLISFYMRSIILSTYSTDKYISFLTNLIKILIYSGFIKEAEEISKLIIP